MSAHQATRPATTPIPDAAPEPGFAVLGARPLLYAATPTLLLDLQVAEPSGRPVYMVALTIQVMIEPARRSYESPERERLEGLFGPPERWGVTTRTLQWAQLDVLVPAFTGVTVVPVPVPCSYDMELAAAKYLHSLQDGQAPLALHFNGRVYYENEAGGLQVALVPWSTSISFRMPVAAWRETVAHYYPNTSWLGVHEDTLRSLERYRVRRGLPTYDDALRSLVANGCD